LAHNNNNNNCCCRRRRRRRLLLFIIIVIVDMSLPYYLAIFMEMLLLLPACVGTRYPFFL
jgi:hypothetical protein